MPRERISGLHNGYGFVEMGNIIDAEYAMAVLQGVPLFGRPLRILKVSGVQSSRPKSIGAKLFVGRLDPAVTEQLLEQLFAPFGPMLAPPRLIQSEETSLHPRSAHAFLDFASFEAADKALQTMEGHHVMGKPIHLEYANNKAANGEKHGSVAERELAKRQQMNAQNSNLIYFGN